MFAKNSFVPDKFTHRSIEEIFSLLEKILSPQDIEKLEIVYPPEKKWGDFSLPCFSLTKSFRQPPEKIAQKLSQKIKIKKRGVIKEVRPFGPYLNFWVNPEKQAKMVLRDIVRKNFFQESILEKKEKVLLEFLSPNTNKPLHLGHGRNAFLGESLFNILSAIGYKVVKVCLINDRGVHICKSMLAYKKKGKGLTPEDVGIKPDHFVGDYYALFEDMKKNNSRVEKEAQKMLKKWERGDKETKKLWRKMTDWALEGLQETLDKVKISFHKYYFESRIYKKGKNIVLKAFQKGKFVKKDGAIIADLSRYNLPDKVLLRQDGTALYITQDIYLTYLKQRDFHPQKIVHIIGDEQNLAQKQLFAIMDILGFRQAKNLHHLSYGMVNVEGGKLKSREGTRVDLDTLIKDLEKMAVLEIKSRYEKLNEEEVERRSQKIALGALKYYILQYNAKNTVNFNPEKSLSFTGRTGPYLQYTYARIKSIFVKTGNLSIKSQKVDFSLLKFQEEKDLIFILGRYKQVILESAENYNPALLARYLYEVAKLFNVFYHSCPVLGASKPVQEARLLLIWCVAEIIKNGLSLLGIETVDEM